MRVSHLSDYEIQEFLDRTRRRETLSLQASPVKEHIDGCIHCQQTIREYEELYDGISCCPQPELSSDFTASVISRLPVRSVPGQILAPALVAVLSTIVGLVAVFLTVDVRSLLGRAVYTGWQQYLICRNWLVNLSMPELSLPSFSFVSSSLESVTVFVTSHGQAGTLLLFIAATLLLICTVDRLLLGKAYQRI